MEVAVEPRPLSCKESKEAATQASGECDGIVIGGGHSLVLVWPCIRKSKMHLAPRHRIGALHGHAVEQTASTEEFEVHVAEPLEER